MTKPRRDVVQVGGQVLRKQSLAASVSRACASCGGPPPLPDSDAKTCLHCGAVRPKNEDLGEVWSREFRGASVRSVIREWFLSKFKRVPQ